MEIETEIVCEVLIEFVGFLGDELVAFIQRSNEKDPMYLNFSVIFTLLFVKYLTKI